MTVRDNVRESVLIFIEASGGKAKFADIVVVSRSSVTQWVQGKNAPDIETIARMCKLFSVKLSDVLEGDPYGTKREELFEADCMEKLLAAYARLNHDGKREAVKRVQELSELPRYKTGDGVDIQAA